MKLLVVVHPNSKKTKIITDLLQTVHVYVSEPAIEGKANKAVVETLAKAYGVPKSAVTMVWGHKSRLKLFALGDQK